MPLPSILRYYRPKATKIWLQELQGHGARHGSRLTDILSDPQTYPKLGGDPDSSYSTDRILSELETAGWIAKQGNPCPSRQQQFFGHGGSWPTQKRAPIYPAYFMWSPGPNAQDAWNWLKEEEP